MSEEQDHKPKIKVYKLPEVRMTRAAWDRLFAFSKIAGDRGSECIGVLLGTVNPREKNFIVDDVLLGFAKQASGAYTQIDWPTTWKDMSEEQKKRVVGWWHSHHYMDHFHSGTDEATHRREYLQYSDNLCLTMTVSLKTSSVLCRVDTDWASWDDLIVDILEPLKQENTELEKVFSELDDMAKKMAELDKKASDIRETKQKELIDSLRPEVDKKLPRTVYSYGVNVGGRRYWDGYDDYTYNPHLLGKDCGINNDYTRESASKLSDAYVRNLTQEIALLEDRRVRVKKKGKLSQILSKLTDLYGEMDDVISITKKDPLAIVRAELGITNHATICQCELCRSMWLQYPKWRDIIFTDQQTTLKASTDAKKVESVKVPPKSAPVDPSTVVKSISAGSWKPGPKPLIQVPTKIGGRESSPIPSMRFNC
jgi:hypothetical protein